MSSGEHSTMDKKSLRAVVGRAADFNSLACDCVCFANAAGGQLLIGIEDGQTEPPLGQRIDCGLLDTIRKRVGELTVNVSVHPEVTTHANGGQFVVLTVARSMGVASTTDGRYFARIGDKCQPVLGDDVLRLANERPSLPWEAMTSQGVAGGHLDAAKVTAWAAQIRESDRVKASVREKTDGELLEHYRLTDASKATNLGVLLVGKASDRARLGTAPVIQAITYDDQGTKVSKHVWDDHELSPLELIEAVWREVPTFRESYEVPDGLLRSNVPAFDEAVVRELLVNALVHRPYTQRGDIFLNLHPDRLEVVNPGRLPLGVTPQNILHTARRRNDGMARVFHDLKLMEREGSGFDLMFERLLSTGRAAPSVKEGTDSVHVVVPKRVIRPEVVHLLKVVDQRHHLSQRERIALALLAQTEGLTAAELAERLELDDTAALTPWTGRLLEFGLVGQTGRTKGTRYFVPPEMLRGTGLDGRTTLTRVQPHRLKALILEDLERYPDSSSTDVLRRTGPELSARTVRRVLEELMAAGEVVAKGERRWRTYRLSIGHEKTRGGQ